MRTVSLLFRSNCRQLTCVYQHGLMSDKAINAYAGQVDEEMFWVPAIFESHDLIRCPIPTRYDADEESSVPAGRTQIVGTPEPCQGDKRHRGTRPMPHSVCLM